MRTCGPLNSRRDGKFLAMGIFSALGPAGHLTAGFLSNCQAGASQVADHSCSHAVQAVHDGYDPSRSS